jgi:hypothetical protein
MKEIILSEKHRIASLIIAIIIGVILGIIIDIFFPWRFFGGDSILLSFLMIIAMAIIFPRFVKKEVPKRYLATLTFLEKRYPIFLEEGIWYLIIPGILNTEDEDIREMTLGKENDKYVEAKSHSMDRVEMSVSWSSQLQIINPIKWFNTQEPKEAVVNKFLSQLRIATSLFVSTDLILLKGVVAGLFFGKTYVVFRLPGGYLLRDRNGNIIAEEIIAGDKDTAISKLMEKATAIKNPFEDADGQIFNPQEDVKEELVEIIPPSVFNHEDLNHEALRIGAKIQAPAIKDITPPPKISDAWEESEIERAQKKARERENEAHMSIALMLMGKKEGEDRGNWSNKEWERFQQLMAVVRAQEKNNEKIVRIIGEGDLGDKIIAAADIMREKK